jgi:hypothetical protein
MTHSGKVSLEWTTAGRIGRHGRDGEAEEVGMMVRPGWTTVGEVGVLCMCDGNDGTFEK